MKIYIARHGQSQWQVEPSQKWDTSLTDIGHEQARRMGHWLANHKLLYNETRLEIASLCTSPLKRAQETASYVARSLNLPLYTYQCLTEANFHVSEHLPQLKTPLQLQTSYQVSPSYAKFKAQAETTLKGLVEQAEMSRGPVLAITHGALIKTLLRIVVNSDAICFRLFNTALNLIEWKRGRWHLVHLNLWDHLPIKLRTF